MPCDKSDCACTNSAVDHPAHYGGADNPYEAIRVIEAWGLGFCLGNVVKYIARHQHKGRALEDLRKARWYLDREIAQMETPSPAPRASEPPAEPPGAGEPAPPAPPGRKTHA